VDPPTGARRHPGWTPISRHNPTRPVSFFCIDKHLRPGQAAGRDGRLGPARTGSGVSRCRRTTDGDGAVVLVRSVGGMVLGNEKKPLRGGGGGRPR